MDKSLNASALEAEKRIEKGFSIRNCESWTLDKDGVCQALWFRRVKAEKTLAEIEPDNAVGACQFVLTNEEHTPFNWALTFFASAGISACPAGPAKILQRS